MMKSNKGFWIVLGVSTVVAGYIYYKNKNTPNTVVTPPNSTPGVPANPVNIPSGTVGSNTVPTNAPTNLSVIGNNAISIGDNNYVRSSAAVESILGVTNNIIGILSANEFAGVVDDTSVDSAGTLWYHVSRGTDYSTSLSITGIIDTYYTHDNGWVAANSVTLS